MKKLMHKINKFYKKYDLTFSNITLTKSDMYDHDALMTAYEAMWFTMECYDTASDGYRWLLHLYNELDDYMHNPPKYTLIKRLAALILVMGAFLMTTGCVPPSKAEPKTYTTYGRYYTNGTVITNDGNEWAYTTDTISDRTPTDAMPVWVGMDDNGTPDDITDDIILGLVYDRNTAIYDALETALSDEFEIERNGNNIKISN